MESVSKRGISVLMHWDWGEYVYSSSLLRVFSLIESCWFHQQQASHFRAGCDEHEFLVRLQGQ